MDRKAPPNSKPDKAQSREDRLKAALKANMGRRKAQARARAGQTGVTAQDKSSEGQD